MAFSEHSNRILLVGLWISLSCHVFGAMGFVRYGPELISSHVDPVSRESNQPLPKTAEPEPESLPQTVRLGLTEASANTLTWLGFQEATEHAAPLGRTEQSPMTLT